MPATATLTRPFHLLAKPTGSACNLACDYCFFLRKSALYPGQKQRMTRALLELYVSQLFAAHPDGEVAVAFQGGEPTLMGLDFFRRVTELTEQYRRPGQIPLFSVQTNATLIDSDWAEFLAEHDFLVGVSIDGPAEVHDAYRRSASGQPSHARVMESIVQLDDAGVQWNALTTVHRASQGRGVDVYEFLRDVAGARFIQFIPVVEREADAAGTPVGSGVTARSTTATAYGEFLTDVFDRWIGRDVGEVFVQDFDIALAAWAGEGHPLCVHSPACGSALAMEFNGDVYSCDHFVEPDHLLGNIADSTLEDLIDSAEQRSFGQRKRSTLPRACASCEVVFACNGGCPKDRFAEDGEGGLGANYLCNGYRAFYRHVDGPMRAMAALLAQGLPPSGVMGLAAGEQRRPLQAFAGTGRNDQCPCGSGRKFKRCHGALR